MNGKQKWDEMDLGELLNQLERVNSLNRQAYNLYRLYENKRDLERSEELGHEADELKKYISERFGPKETITDGEKMLIREKWKKSGRLKTIETNLGTIDILTHPKLDGDVRDNRQDK